MNDGALALVAKKTLAITFSGGQYCHMGDVLVVATCPFCLQVYPVDLCMYVEICMLHHHTSLYSVIVVSVYFVTSLSGPS